MAPDALYCNVFYHFDSFYANQNPCKNVPVQDDSEVKVVTVSVTSNAVVVSSPGEEEFVINLISDSRLPIEFSMGTNGNKNANAGLALENGSVVPRYVNAPAARKPFFNEKVFWKTILMSTA